MKEINLAVNKAIRLQSVDDILSVNQLEYRSRLTEYFSKLVSKDNSLEFNTDVLHDIIGLKTNDKHFIPRL